MNICYYEVMCAYVGRKHESNCSVLIKFIIMCLHAGNCKYFPETIKDHDVAPQGNPY